MDESEQPHAPGQAEMAQHVWRAPLESDRPRHLAVVMCWECCVASKRGTIDRSLCPLPRTEMCTLDCQLAWRELVPQRLAHFEQCTRRASLCEEPTRGLLGLVRKVAEGPRLAGTRRLEQHQSREAVPYMKLHGGPQAPCFLDHQSSASFLALCVFTAAISVGKLDRVGEGV